MDPQKLCQFLAEHRDFLASVDSIISSIKPAKTGAGSNPSLQDATLDAHEIPRVAEVDDGRIEDNRTHTLQADVAEDGAFQSVLIESSSSDGRFSSQVWFVWSVAADRAL